TITFPTLYTDPIYGEMNFGKEGEGSFDLSENVGKLINCGALQRLRNIKQLSLAYYEYPDATHTRFSHSLGLGYLVKKALEELRKNERSCIEIEKEIVNDCVIASILHDIGHGPFGHVTESFLGRLPKFEYKHETFTLEFINRGLLDLGVALGNIHINKAYVLSLIDPNKPKKTHFALGMLISNKGIDLDRVDFLFRDIYHSGLQTEKEWIINPYSREDRQKFINILLSKSYIISAESLSQEEREKAKIPEGATILCFEDTPEVRKYVNFFFKLYTVMYHKVYGGHVNRSAQAMIAKALHFAYETGELDVEDVHAFTDPEMFAFLENCSDNKIRDLAKCVKYRYLFKKLFTFKLADKNKTAKDIEDLIKKEINKDLDTKLSNILIIDIIHPREVGPVYLKNDSDEVKPYNYNPESEQESNLYNELKEGYGSA
ncbi:MAG: HD domain-containing protein, partial [Candidatus Jordarchaeaceae archaeon]